jgi:hypothetical protein
MVRPKVWTEVWVCGYSAFVPCCCAVAASAPLVVGLALH